MTMMKISYDPEGDLLEVQFTTSHIAPKGIGLTDHITLFCDENFQLPLGLTAMAYTKLLAHPKLPLTELLEAPQDIQQKVRNLLQRSPLAQFIHIEDDSIGLEDFRMSELVTSLPSTS